MGEPARAGGGEEGALHDGGEGEDGGGGWHGWGGHLPTDYGGVQRGEVGPIRQEAEDRKTGLLGCQGSSKEIYQKVQANTQKIVIKDFLEFVSYNDPTNSHNTTLPFEIHTE